VVNPANKLVAIVCSVHREVVKSPANHLKQKHKGTEFPPNFFGNFEQVEMFPKLDPPMLALPYVKVVDGVKCAETLVVSQHLRHLNCCGKKHNSLTTVRVKIQRIDGDGCHKRAVEVTVRDESFQAGDSPAAEAAIADAIGVVPQPAEDGLRNVPEFSCFFSGFFIQTPLTHVASTCVLLFS